jgi:hypothetical protein
VIPQSDQVDRWPSFVGQLRRRADLMAIGQSMYMRLASRRMGFFGSHAGGTEGNRSLGEQSWREIDMRVFRAGDLLAAAPRSRADIPHADEFVTAMEQSKAASYNV